MCWLHIKTKGLANLSGCTGPPYSARGNRVGFGPQDYWISSDLSGWHELKLRLRVRFLMLFHKKHHHHFAAVKSATGRTLHRCHGCGEYQDIGGRTVLTREY